MTAIKCMLLGIVFILLGILCAVWSNNGSWFGGAGIIFPLVGLFIFIGGICIKEKK